MMLEWLQQESRDDHWHKNGYGLACPRVILFQGFVNLLELVW